MKTKILFILALAILPLAAGLAVSSCGGDDDDDSSYGTDDDNGIADDDDAAGDVVEVIIDNMDVSPDPVNIAVGDTVRWINEDSVPHTATSGAPDDADAGSIFDSGTLNTGDSFEFTFDSAGTFEYFCQIHPTTMFGYQVVVAP